MYKSVKDEMMSWPATLKRMRPGALLTADAAALSAEAELLEAAADVLPFWVSSCFESRSSLSIIWVSSKVVVVLVPP